MMPKVPNLLPKRTIIIFRTSLQMMPKLPNILHKANYNYFQDQLTDDAEGA